MKKIVRDDSVIILIDDDLAVLDKVMRTNEDIYLLKPQTYMNLSGEVVIKFVN